MLGSIRLCLLRAVFVPCTALAVSTTNKKARYVKRSGVCRLNGRILLFAREILFLSKAEIAFPSVQ